MFVGIIRYFKDNSGSVDELLNQNYIENCCYQQIDMYVSSIPDWGYRDRPRLKEILGLKCPVLAALVKDCISNEVNSDASLYFALRYHFVFNRPPEYTDWII
ncbi:hypothetical protein RF11_01871 [Thelohanellus kitauei]|uniref:Uncharacterized protein n=1 Tax=Thelohanellus kitauei TaxID=669202 RepID=A0A0C2MNE1_THEKT|nr:hypothetical protein RF11_01871 [Thelohanellus kitauei]